MTDYEIQPDGREVAQKVDKAYELLFRLGGKESQVVLDDLRYFAERQCHVPGDPYSSAYNEGMRMMAQQIIDLANGDNNGRT